MYTAEMSESVQRVEASRSRRVAERFPSLSPDERQAILREFHPDYITQAMRPLVLGPNQGNRTPNELADVLEAAPVLDPHVIDLSEAGLDTDVLIIGGGGAGASAALVAQENGAEVVIATKLRFGDANTMMAQGGIQAADKETDSPAIHYLDVMGGGGFVNDPDLVEALTLDAPMVIQWLERLGAMFEKDAQGRMVTIHGGGTSRKRMHYARDYSGAEIMRILRDEVWNREHIRVIEFAPAIELLMNTHGECTGAVLLNLETGEHLVVHAKATILTTGGGGRLHYQGFPTTNHYGATADGLVLAYRVGAKLAFIDTMQYHPTGAAFPEQILGQLVTEKVRGLGAQVCNANGDQFVYPLETRDVESAAFIRECKERGKGIRTPTGQFGVWLDSPMIDLLNGPGTCARELPAMVRQYKRFGLDMAREPILVYPTLHYQNGGVKINAQGLTGVPNLYAAGEVAGGIHGRNRLMGNSLLDICVFGRRAGQAAAECARQPVQANAALTLDHVERWNQARAQAGLNGNLSAPVILPDYTRKVI